MEMTGNNLADKFESKFNSRKNKLKVRKKPGKKHRTYEVYYNGFKVVPFVMFSHGSRDLTNKPIGLIARQLGIRSRQVRGIESCSFGGEEFVSESSNITDSEK